MIKSIETCNFHGGSGTVEFGKFNLFVGPNGSGKSRNLLAILYAATGNTPTSALSGAVLEHATGNHCSVGVKLDSGFSWTRDCKRNPHTQTVTSTIVIPSERKLSVTAAQHRIENRIGSFVPMFDIKLFLSMKAEARREFIIDLCSGAVAADVLLKALAAAGASDAYADMEGAGQIIDKLVCDLNVAREDVLSLGRTERGIASSLLELIARKDAISSVGESVSELRTEIADITTRISSLDERIGKSKGLRSAIARLSDAVESAKKKRLAVVAAIAAHDSGQLQYVAWNEEYDEAVKIAETDVPGFSDMGLEIAHGAEVDASRNWKSLLGVESVRWEEMNKCGLEYRLAEKTVASLAPWVKVRDLAMAIPLAGLINPVINTIRVDLIALADKSMNEGGPYADRVQERERLLSLFKDATLALADAREHTKEAEQASENAKEIVCGKEQASRDAQRDHSAAEDRRREAKAKASNVAVDMREYERHGLELASKLKDADAEVVESERKRNEIDVEGAESIETLQDDRKASATNKSDLDGKLEHRQKRDTIAAEVEKLIEDGHQIRSQQTKVKDEVESLKKLRDVAVGAMMAPLIDGMQEVLGVPMYCRLVNERGKPTFDLGLNRDGNMIPLDSLSGGEKTLFCAAMIIVMVNIADPPEKLLLIEGAELDQENMGILRAVIQNRASGFQCFLTSIQPLRFFPADNDWTVFNLKGPKDEPEPSTTPAPTPATTPEKPEPSPTASV